MRMGCGILRGEHSERRFVYIVEEREESSCIATKTVVAPHPRSPAGPSSDERRVACGPQPPAARCCMSEPSASVASGASCVPAHGGRRAVARGHASLAPAGPSCLLPAHHLPQRIVAEQFPPLVPVRGRHRRGVCSALRHVGLAVGGRAGVRLARALGLPGSYRAMVGLVHDAPFPPLKAPRVTGLDAWAWRRGRRFGTIMCDLERHQVVDLLPVRAPPSVAPWRQAHPSMAIVCRDRRGLSAEGSRQGAPQTIQVVDRFHLVRNLREALERSLLRSRRALTTLSALPHRIVRADAGDHQPGTSHPMGAALPSHAATACPTRGDCCHGAAAPGQSSNGLPASRHAPAARAATVTTPRTAPDHAVYPVSATVMACRLSPCPTTLAGPRGPGAPAVTDDGGAGPSADCGGRRAPGVNSDKWRLRPSMRTTMTRAVPPP